MKKIAIITPVPEMVHAIIEQSMLRKAASEKVAEYNVFDLREFGKAIIARSMILHLAAEVAWS